MRFRQSYKPQTEGIMLLSICRLQITQITVNTHIHIYILFYISFYKTCLHPKKWTCPPEKGLFQKRIIFLSHWNTQGKFVSFCAEYSRYSRHWEPLTLPFLVLRSMKQTAPLPGYEWIPKSWWVWKFRGSGFTYGHFWVSIRSISRGWNPPIFWASSR